MLRDCGTHLLYNNSQNSRYYTNDSCEDTYMRSPPMLSWRLDPEESLSDWTISVVSSPNLEERDAKCTDRYSNGSNDKRDEASARVHRSKQRNSSSSVQNDLALTKVYFVHRAQLAVGPRKSDFFTNLFKKEKSKQQLDCGSSDSTTGTSRNYTKIELIPAAASCFPIMLDYLYSTEGTPLAITTNSAVALRRLASTFGMRSMFKETTLFIKEDLKPETSTTYLLDAEKFKNAKLKDSAIQVIGSNFLTIKFSSFVRIPTNLMKEIIHSGKVQVDDEVKYSSRIAAYCRCREDELNLICLNCYTNASILSAIDDSESIYFLHLLFHLREKECNSNIDSMNLFQLCMLIVPKVLGSLHSSKSVLTSGSYDKATVRKQKKDLELYSDLPAEIKVQLLERSFESSQRTPEIYLKAQPEQGIDRRAKKQVHMLQKEVDQLKHSYEKKVTYYQRMLDAKVEELKRFSECGDLDSNGPLLCSPINILRTEHSSGSSSRISDMKGSSMS